MPWSIDTQRGEELRANADFSLGVAMLKAGKQGPPYNYIHACISVHMPTYIYISIHRCVYKHKETDTYTYIDIYQERCVYWIR